MKTNLAKKVTRDQVLAALKYIDENQIPLSPSTGFDLLHKGRSYPPKEVIRHAARIAGITDLSSYWINGGDPTNIPLKEMGFDIQAKDTKIVSSSPDKLFGLLTSYLDNIPIDTAFGDYLFKGKNSTLVFAALGGRARDPKSNPGYVFSNPTYSWIFRFIIDGGNAYIVVENIYKKVQLANYKLVRGQTFVRQGNTTFLKENYIVTVNTRQPIEKVKEAMMRAGLSNDGYILNYDEIDVETHEVMISLLKWAEFRQRAKKIIKENGVDGSFDEQPKQNQRLNMPYLNTILYGPPGTGKTYKLKSLITEMNLVEYSSGVGPEPVLFVQGLKWWELLALVLNEKKRASVPELLEHPLIKAKLISSDAQNHPQRVWGTLQNHTVRSCPNVKSDKRLGELIFYKEPDSTWRLDNQPDFGKQFPYLVSEWESFNKISQGKAAQKNYTFMTCHQSLSYEDFVEGIKPNLKKDDDGDAEESLQYENRKGLFYQACDKAARRAGFGSLQMALKASVEERKLLFEKAIAENRVHVLFLDEISRCNVSAVFGELITLVEDDKRLGAENEIADIVLPYSQDLFGVPLNLYIIGTMNTADRSVEALDTALRRRFTFAEMAPNPELLNSQRLIWNLWWEFEHVGWDNEMYARSEKGLYELLGVPEKFGHDDVLWTPMQKEGKNEQQILLFNSVSFNGLNLEKMLAAINLRLTALLTREHTIGHAWLLNVASYDELRYVFRNKIIPLLQEYFYNDYAKVGLVLGKSFVEKTSAKGIFAKSYNDDSDLKGEYEGRTIYSLVDPSKLGPADFKAIYL